MTAAEWESLCDGCGKCCLVQLEDEETGERACTSIACRLLDRSSLRCLDYDNRHARVPDCVRLTPENAGRIDWMPETCAYRLLANGEPLPDWHPLVTGDRASTRKAGMAARRPLYSEADIPEAEMEAYIRSDD